MRSKQAANGNFLDAANSLPVILAERGYIVLPLRPGTKEPAADHLPGGKTDGLKRHPFSPRQVEDLMRQFPGLGWGVIRDRFCTLDFDSEAARANPDHHVPLTPTVRTARGFQLWFVKPLNVELTNRRLSADLELLVNGIAILPGHIHPTGHIYHWVDGLSLLEIPPAELPRWAIVLYMKHATQKAGKVTTSRRPVRPHPAKDMGDHPPAMAADLLAKLNDDEVARRLLVRHKIQYREGATFKCILPGHEERRPSANIWRSPEGNLLYRDHHRRSGRGSYRLTDIYAAVATGELRVLGHGEQVVWGIRMLADLELLSLPDRVVDAPLSLTVAERKVWEGIVLLARCRYAYGPHAEPFPLGWPFMARWCGVGESTVSRALKKFLRLGYLRLKKRPHQTKLTLFVFGRAARPTAALIDIWPEVVLFAVAGLQNDDSISYDKRYYLHSWRTADP
jgi:hypothetical protein